MKFQCIVRVNRTVGKWNSDIVDAPVFWVEAQNHAEALLKVKQMFDSLLIANDSLYVDTMSPDDYPLASEDDDSFLHTHYVKS